MLAFFRHPIRNHFYPHFDSVCVLERWHCFSRTCIILALMTDPLAGVASSQKMLVEVMAEESRSGILRKC